MLYCPEVACYNLEPCISHQSTAILDFWFGQGAYEYRSGLWWKGIQPGTHRNDYSSPQEAQLRTDNYIRDHFGWLLKELLDGNEQIKEWGSNSSAKNSDGKKSPYTPQERVAFVILCDQFSRNAYRGDPKMFAFDKYAQETALDLLSSYQKHLSWNHRVFCCVALEHSEDVNVVEKALLDVRILTTELQAIEKAKDIIHHMKKLILAFQSHIKTLKKFDRYPHRNSLLNRVSTPEELTWLKSERLPVWAKSIRPLNLTDNGSNSNSNAKTWADKKTLATAAAAATATPVQRSLRILVLHGNRSSLGKFRKKTKVAFGKLISQGHFLHYINAPHIYAKQENDEKKDRIQAGIDHELQHQINRCWWSATDDPQTMVYNGLNESIEYFEHIFENEGPFDGILGFAQGATMGAILAALQHEKRTRFIRFKFFIDISGFYCRDTRPEFFQLHVIKTIVEEEGKKIEKIEPKLPLISIPSFHTWGLQDELIEGWRTEMLSRCFDHAVTLPHPAGHFTSALNQWPIVEISQWLNSLQFESVSEMLLSGSSSSNSNGDTMLKKKSFKETVLAIASCRQDEAAVVGGNLQQQQQQRYTDLPVALTFPSLASDEFWVNKGQVMLTNNGMKQKDCEDFVARAFALVSSTASSTTTDATASSSTASNTQYIDLIDDLLLLGWTIFPFKTPPKNKVQSQGEVFYWLFYHTYLQANGAGRHHILTSRLPLLAEYGNWAALVRLALLDATGSSLRQGIDGNEIKENETSNSNDSSSGNDDTERQRVADTKEKERKTDNDSSNNKGDREEDSKPSTTAATSTTAAVPAAAAAAAAAPEDHYAAIAKVSELNRAIAELFTTQLFNDYNNVTRLGNDLNVRDMDYDSLVVKRLDLISKGGSFPSTCALHAPRMQTYVSRTTFVPQAIAAMLMLKWQQLENKEKEKENNNSNSNNNSNDDDYTEKPTKSTFILPKFANTLYRNVLAQILSCLKQLSKDTLSRMRAPDLSWYSLSTEDWEKLKISELSSSVRNPEPEPVDVSSAQQLQPLYEFLKSGKNLFEMKPRINKGIQELSFERGTICSDGRLDLCKQVIGPSGVEDLMKTLRADSEKQHALVKHILLGNNVAGDSLASGIAQFIHSGQSKLTTWYIAGNRLTGEGLLPLTEAFANDTQVRQLWLKRNPLRLRGAEAISNLLTHNHYLQVLDLTTTGLLDEGVTALMQGLEQNHGLQYLYLDGNGITLNGLNPIKNYLLSHKGRLQGLSLGCNRIGDQGTRILCEGLMDHPTIVRLVLPSCGLGSEAAIALAELLMTNKKLLYLDLGFQNMTAALREAPNRIGSQGAIALANSLRVNRTLKYLDLTQNQIHQDGMSALQKAICDDENNNSRIEGGLIELKMQQFGIPLNELTLEQLRLHVKKKRSLLIPLPPDVEEALRPAHLEEIASVYRVGHAYKDEKLTVSGTPVQGPTKESIEGSSVT